MTLRLLERSWHVHVWNLEPENIAPIVAAGAVAEDSPANVARASDIVLMCVLNTQAVESCVLPQCLAGGHADSNLLRKLYPQMQARDFDPPRSFARQLLKDMKAVKEFAHGLGLELPVVESAVECYAAYVGQGDEMQDSASIVRLYEGKAK
jgi:3-hydroxyisobutyrate dehydrogenase-like beta-hydroxyacid dehydrogenase